MTMDTRAHIGHLAGLVYRGLEGGGKPLSVLDIAFKLKMWPWDVFMALGWLSSEDKVKLRRNLLALIAELRRE